MSETTLEARVEGLERDVKKLAMMVAGKCPECERPIRGKFDPVGKAHSFAPEIFASLREQGIDTRTGHKVGCKHGGLRL